MKEIQRGWVIVNIGHPTNGRKSIFNGSYRQTKRGCINDFLRGTNGTWQHWRNKWHFRCVRATQTIETEEF